ncbi:MAG: hypothetical protein JST85_19925 [Acidobacteria bacterium]|nr:hypothetical protein [Acidobacteriota bacterium]
MLKGFVLFLLIATLPLLATCKSQGNEPEIIDASKVTEIRVTFFNKNTGQAREQFKVVILPTEIDSLVNFTNKYVIGKSNSQFNVESLIIQDPSTTINLAFYQSDSYLGTLGLGRYKSDKFFVKYRWSDKSKAAIISSEQKKELLDLLGFSEEQYNSLFPK